jgi:hypothetical protein
MFVLFNPPTCKEGMWGGGENGISVHKHLYPTFSPQQAQHKIHTYIYWHHHHDDDEQQQEEVLCHTLSLTFTLKRILRRQKTNYGNSNISPCKNTIFRKSSKRNQNKSFKILL